MIVRLVLPLAALCSLGSASGQNPSLQDSDRAPFAADLDLVLETIREQHPQPHRVQDAQRWKKAEASLRFRLDALSRDQFHIELRRLVALLADGSSRIEDPKEGARLPLRFEFFAEGLIVTASNKANAKLLGKRVLELGGHPVSDLLRALRSYVCADNDAQARERIASTWLREPRLLHAAGLCAAPESLTLRCEGMTQALRIDATPSKPSERVGAGEDLPTLDAQVRLGCAYLRIRDFAEASKGEFARFCRSAIADFERDRQLDKLAIDLRACAAGRRDLVQALVHALLRSRFDRPGALFVLIDSACTSTGMRAATRIERETHALFVGTASGARPNAFGHAKSTPLPGSGLRLLCSTLPCFESDPRDDRLAILPDLPVARSFARERAGIDAALRAIADWQHKASRGFDDTAPLLHWKRPSQRRKAVVRERAKTPRSAGPKAPPPGKARETYLGRRIATTMHWLGARWLMRRTREKEEQSSKLLASFGLTEGLDVCDFGCGNGFHTLPMAERVGPQGRVYAVDIQKQMLTLLAQRQKKRGLTNIVRIQNGLADTGLPPASCDLILLVDVYHELSHPVRVLAGLRRALKPGGRLVLVEFRAEDPKVPIKKLHKMSKAQVQKELEANGFRLHASFDELPWQHVLTYVRAAD